MNRTWDMNRQAINQLWPMMTFTDEEKRLWHDDLSGVDQGVLYDALRNVKRNNDSNYPHLKWVRDEYRVLSRLVAPRRQSATDHGKPVRIDADADARLREELKDAISGATQADFTMMVDLIADKAATLQITMTTAFRLVRYLLERLGISNGMHFGGAQ